MRAWFRQIPNVISSIRILLVIPIALSVFRGEWALTLGLFVAAVFSDAADGFLAKRYGWQTTLGGILDPAADKALLATLFIVLSVLGFVPAWLTASVVARDLIIVLGAIAYRLYLGPLAAHPSFISKVNTLCQALYLLCVIGRQQFAALPPWIVIGLGALTFVTVAISGMDYVLRYGQAALEEARSRRSGSASDRSGPT